MRKLITLIFLISCGFVFSQKNEFTAKEVIKKVVENKVKNFIKNALNSYKYHSYNKLTFTIDESLVDGKIDSIFKVKNNKKSFEKLDSSNYFLKNEVGKTHFYISEKIALHKYKNKKSRLGKGKEKENILAIKMAGFQEPIYEFLALGITNISFYNDTFSLFGINYVSPLANKSYKEYQFKFDQFNTNQENYIIKYKSINRKKSVGLEGEFHIDKKSFAIVKSVAKINGQVNVYVEQEFKFLAEEKLWFPKNLTIFLRRGASKKSVKAFRKLIGYKTNYVSEKNINPEDISYILINATNYNIEINKPLKIAKNECAIEIDQDAAKRNSMSRNEFDLMSKDSKDINTYIVLDSIVKEKKIEQKLNVLRKFLDGKFATKLLDIDLSNVINFNNHEGFRLGFGGTTNDNLSKNFRLNGYLANGNKDKQLKYHYGADVKLRQSTNTWFGGSYTSDIFEAAKSKLLFEEPNFAIINPRNLNISQFYSYRITEAHMHHEITPRIEIKLQFDVGNYKNEFDYTFISRDKLLQKFKLSQLTLAFKWTPFSTYLKSPKGKFLIKKGYPIVKLELSKNFNRILDGDFDFAKVNLNIEHQIETIKNGSMSFLLKAGYVNGEAPLSHLYNVTPNHSLVNPWRARINFSGTNAFETMLFNEFISDKFVSVQARQNFEKFRIGKKFKPELSLIARFAIGDIENSNHHQGVNFNRMNKGYLESGLVINQLFYGLGVSGFYRLGAYHFAKVEDNIALKITYVINLF